MLPYNKYCTLRKAIITFVRVQPSYCVVPEHTYTLPIDAGHWKFRGGRGTKKTIFKHKYGAKLKFLKGSRKKHPWGEGRGGI